MPATSLITVAGIAAEARRGAAERRELRLDDQTLSYLLKRAPRRSVAIHVGAQGVEVRAPRWAPLADIEGFMQRKARWIRRRMAEARAPAAPFRWEPGAMLPVLGREVLLAAAPGLHGIVHDGATLRIGAAPPASRRPPPPPAEDWRTRVLAWLRAQALAHYAGRASEFAAALEVPLPALKLSNAVSQWGSCVRRSNGTRVLLHWKLYLMPPHLVDYVVAHELAHLRELNHSPRFWAALASVYPDPVAARRELNRRGRALPRL